MAWTAPHLWVSGESCTAALLNAHLSANLLETMPGKATGPDASGTGGFFVVDGTAPTRLEERYLTEDYIGQSESTAGTSFTNLTTVGPTVTVNSGTRALVYFGARMYNGTANAQCCMSYAVSGATTLAAADTSMLCIDGLATANRQQQTMYDFLSSLTSGINTFTAKYRAGGAGTAYYFWRRLGVWPM